MWWYAGAAVFFPSTVAVLFFRRGAYVQAALCALWFFQNFLNIARYAADARAQRFPLVEATMAGSIFLCAGMGYRLINHLQIP